LTVKKVNFLSRHILPRGPQNQKAKSPWFSQADLLQYKKISILYNTTDAMQETPRFPLLHDYPPVGGQHE
jgi:hypothetical protein